MGASGIILGTLDHLELQNGEQLNSGALRGLLLGWLPRSRDLIIVRKRKQIGEARSLPSDVVALHRRFHDAPPRRAPIFDWDEPRRVREIGRLRELVYVIPEGLVSPEKVKFRWRHFFGDHGERGHGPSESKKPKYPTKFMPMMCEGANGNLYIKRMPGNRYTVDDWMLW